MTFFQPEPPDVSAATAQGPVAPRLLTRRHDGDEPQAAVPVRRRRRFPLRGVLVTLLTLAVAGALALLIGAHWLRKAMWASLPQIDGTLHSAGLAANVTVTRDAHGVPSIQAANMDDALFAQGFVTAQDRLWQMDALRRHGAGDLAEIMGSKLVDHDRAQRTLQIRAAAERALAVMPRDQVHQLETYARGVNAFIAQNGDHLPVEFHLLHYQPAPWTPRDTVIVSLVMAQDLSTEFPTKLLREAFSTHMPKELLADLYPVGSWRDHLPMQAVPDMTSPRPPLDIAPLDETQSRLELPTATPQELLQSREAMLLATCEGCRSGSNNWAVAGARTASGLPLLSNDMHLGLSVPDIWYTVGLHTADGSLDVAGVTLPGAPFVVVGRNAHVAWSFTAMLADTQDIYIEHLRGSGEATEFQRADGAWVKVEHHSEHIRVRGASDVTLDVLTTTHNVGSAVMATPIISPLYPSEHRTLSLAWTIYDPASVNVPFAAVDAATDGAGLASALATFGAPSLSLVYADDHNHIGYHAIGRIPVRGPAVHHPVAVPVPITGIAPPPDEESRVEATPLGRLMTVAFMPQRRSRRKAQAAAPIDPATPITPPARPELDYVAPPPPPPGYTVGSPIPAVPVDALDPEAQWSEYVPYDELPGVVDPPAGFIATANARVTADDYPYALALDWSSPYRVERITKMLQNATGLTAADMLRMEMDVHSELDLLLAHRMAYALDHATALPKDTKRLRQAADILRRWNGEVDATAAAPAIIAATRAELWPMLLEPKIAAHDKATGIASKDATPTGVARLYSWQEQGYALEELVQHTPARWLPPGFADWNDLLAAAVDRGLTAAHAPGDLAKWNFSKTHPVEISHPLLSGIPGMQRVLMVTLGSGPRATGGDIYTVKAVSRAFGPSERFTADMSNVDATTLNLTTGESGIPASPWYLDQLPEWLDGTTHALPLHTVGGVHTLVLTP